MGFEELLKKKLGPMRELVTKAPKPEAPLRDPATLWYRRAAGLELRARPEETWSALELGRADHPHKALVRLDVREASLVAGLTTWRHASDLGAAYGVRPAELWRLVDQDLLFFAPEDPGARLTGRAGVLEDAKRSGPAQKIARRASMWPTPAIETAVQIAPMPFMPRGDDLRGAELVGARFASLEKGFEVFGVTITGSKRLGALIARLLVLLDGTRTPREVLDALPSADRGDAENLLQLFDRATLLELVDGPPAPAARWRDPAGPQVTWLGHAGVLVQTAGVNVLVDPLLFSKSEPEEKGLHPPKPDARALPPLDAILITHGDNDHLNPNTLYQLPRDVPVFIPKLGARPPYQVDLRGVLSVLGFGEVYELEPWAGVALGDASVTACPFAGEDWGLDLAKATFLVESDECSVYLAADSHRMDETYAELARRGRRVDLALMGVSGNAESFAMPVGLGYGNFYRDWIPRARHNEWTHHCAGPADAVHSLERLRPRFAFGYAAGGASYIKTAYSDVGDHAELAARLAAAKAADRTLDTRAVALPLGEPVAMAELAALPEV